MLRGEFENGAAGVPADEGQGPRMGRTLSDRFRQVTLEGQGENKSQSGGRN